MTELHFLHGFLGLPSDWLSAAQTLCDGKPRRYILTDLYAFKTDLVGWARLFNASVVAQPRPDRRILIGYSLGGRLALHALIDSPGLWDAAVIISANPGLATRATRATDDDERRARLAHDEQWARRFENDPWDELLRAWEDQPVFVAPGKLGRSTLSRREADFRRADLAYALREWSLGRQSALLADVATLEMPILWLAGEHDKRFVRFAELAAQSCPNVDAQIIAEAAHRVPWDRPMQFHTTVESFIRSHP